MGLLARSYKFPRKGGKPAVGYIEEFFSLVLEPLLDTILAKGIKVITNAGGLDPVGLKKLIEAHAKKVGLAHKVNVAAVYGDDLLERRHDLLHGGKVYSFDPLNGAGEREEIFGEQDSLLSLNAYTGAEPITEALKQGANIVVTGRCVDSAAVLAPVAFEYGWNISDFSQTNLDRLASTSLAGHILECGAQATGGNFTDWRLSAFSPNGGWANMGYPIASFRRDGSFTISKPRDSGGIVTCHSVCEQMMYEILDPANYILPDVVLDLTRVKLTQASANTVLVTGALGKPPTPFLKCTAIVHKGHRIIADLLIFGSEAESKGLVLGKAVLQRTNWIIERKYKGEVPTISDSSFNVIVIGADHSSTPRLAGSGAREVVMRVCALHDNKDALDILGQEISSFVTSTAPGMTVLSTGRPKASPNFTTSSILVDRQAVLPKLLVGESTEALPVQLALDGCRPIQASANALTFVPNTSNLSAAGTVPTKINTFRTRLIEVAIGRSGDKGDNANVAIIARHPAFYRYILAQVTPAAIHSALSHYIQEGGTITRYEVPGVNAVNFTVTKCLGGGGLASLRLDRCVPEKPSDSPFPHPSFPIRNVGIRWATLTDFLVQRRADRRKGTHRSVWLRCGWTYRSKPWWPRSCDGSQLRILSSQVHYHEEASRKRELVCSID